jgi:hypothetical protein
MRKIYALLVVMGCAVTLKAQLVFNENFTGYANGNLNGKGPVGSTWASSGTGTDVQVATTNPLGYPGYTSGTQFIHLVGTSGVSSYRNFTSAIDDGNSRAVYLSFVIRVNSALTEGNSLVRVMDAAGNVAFSIYADNDNTDHVRFGLNMAGNGESRVYSNGYNFGQTYLIVVRYDIVSGTNNDNVRLWVNPALASTEPTDASAVASIVNSSYEDTYNDLTRVQVRQTTGQFESANADLDGFRVAVGVAGSGNTAARNAWTALNPQGAPLPVKLDNFDATKEAAGIKVYWNASDEIGVKNYQIERSEDGLNFSTIGTVAAEKKKTYSFVDAQPAATSNFYRLKMLDFDGNYKLSHVVSIKSKASLNIILSPNPVKDRMLVQHPKAENNNRIQVINVDGKVLVEMRVPANAVQTNIDLSFVRAGLYHVVFQSEAGVFSKTIFKQ